MTKEPKEDLIEVLAEILKDYYKLYGKLTFGCFYEYIIKKDKENKHLKKQL